MESAVHVETAVFVDSDMFHLMANNFPQDTEREVVRFVLAMVNAVSKQISKNWTFWENTWCDVCNEDFLFQASFYWP